MADAAPAAAAAAATTATADAGDEKMVTLVSMDGDKFEVKKRSICNSQWGSELVKTMAGVEDEEGNSEGSSDEAENEEIPLPNVNTPVLTKVISFCTHHTDNPMAEIAKPLADADMSKVVDKWDADFVDIKQELLFELILAANYMDIKPLLDLTCAKVASMIKGRTPDEIRKIFNISSDFTPEEEIKVRADNKWCEDA